MSRLTKQIVYGCVYGIIFFLLARGAYIAFFTSYPTCFDNLQNQGEERVDCGGPCTACQGPTYDPLVSVEQPMLFTLIPGRVVVLAKIANTNRNFYAGRFGYIFSVQDSKDVTLNRIVGTESIPASTQKYIFGSMETGPGISKGVRAILELEDPEWSVLGRGSEPTLSLPLDVSTRSDGEVVRVEGTIKNSSFSDADNLEIIVLLRDRSDFHDPLYAGKTVIRVGGMSENRFSIAFPPSHELVDTVDPNRTEVFTSIQ